MNPNAAASRSRCRFEQTARGIATGVSGSEPTDRGIIHLHQGRTDVFTTSDGLSGNIICSLFEDHEGNVWVGTSRRNRPVSRAPRQYDLYKTWFVQRYLTRWSRRADGSIWVATHDGLTTLEEWADHDVTAKRDGLPDDMVQSLFCDHRGRIWAVLGARACILRGRQICGRSWRAPATEVYSITGDETDNLWLSGNQWSHALCLKGSWSNIFPGRPWDVRQQAKVVVSESRWSLAFLLDRWRRHVF